MNKKILLLAAVLAVLVAGGAFFALKGNNTAAPAADAAATEQTTASATITTSDVNYDSASLPAEPLGVRTLGNPDAPVTIEEFASLTCGHCAHFHGSTFQELKTKYIDTGKVFFTFTDFPLNAPALEASMVARCMPPERYFSFLSFLFQTQEQWAFNGDYKNNLRQNAKLAGMSDERFDSCLADEALKQGLVNRMQESGTAHSVNSTPSFVVTSRSGKKEVLTGALPIVSFDKAIADAETVTTEPATEAAPEATTETTPDATENTAEDAAVTAPETETPAETPAATETVTEETPAVEEAAPAAEETKTEETTAE